MEQKGVSIRLEPILLPGEGLTGEIAGVTLSIKSGPLGIDLRWSAGKLRIINFIQSQDGTKYATETSGVLQVGAAVSHLNGESVENCDMLTAVSVLKNRPLTVTFVPPIVANDESPLGTTFTWINAPRNVLLSVTPRYNKIVGCLVVNGFYREEMSPQQKTNESSENDKDMTVSKESIRGGPLVVERTGRVQYGDILVAVNGYCILHRSLPQLRSLLKMRPISLSFERPQKQLELRRESESESTLTSSAMDAQLSRNRLSVSNDPRKNSDDTIANSRDFEPIIKRSLLSIKCICNGYLFKKEGVYGFRWNKRYFELGSDGFLRYHVSSFDGKYDQRKSSMAVGYVNSKDLVHSQIPVKGFFIIEATTLVTTVENVAELRPPTNHVLKLVVRSPSSISAKKKLSTTACYPLYLAFENKAALSQWYDGLKICILESIVLTNHQSTSHNTNVDQSASHQSPVQSNVQVEGSNFLSNTEASTSSSLIASLMTKTNILAKDLISVVDAWFETSFGNGNLALILKICRTENVNFLRNCSRCPSLQEMKRILCEHFDEYSYSANASVIEHYYAGLLLDQFTDTNTDTNTDSDSDTIASSTSTRPKGLRRRPWGESQERQLWCVRRTTVQ